MLDGEMKWKILTPMPKPNSHIESSWVVLNNSIIIVGGTTEKHPVTKNDLGWGGFSISFGYTGNVLIYC